MQFLSLEPPPGVSVNHWRDYQWQIKNSLKSKTDYQKYFELTASESEAFTGVNRLFYVRTTPYYATLASRENHEDPIRKILMPQKEELELGVQQMKDPLGENDHRPESRIIHRYPDRCLFLITDFCGVYCRYCTRKHFTGQSQAFPSKDDYEKGLKYIRSQPKIKEVILSGGDPLTLSDEKLEKTLFDLRQIPHVEVIRVGSRIPVVAPMRITKALAKIFNKHKPVFFMTHFNHPREITKEAAIAIETLVDHGVPVMNQMVLLNGVNNHPVIIQALSRRLLFLRAKPYYMFQCDPSLGTDHLRTSVADSLEIQRQLWGRMSGLAMPSLSLDIPDGGGKVGLVPDFKVSSQKGVHRFKGWDGKTHDYIDPPPESIKKPIDVDVYLNE